MAYKGTCIILIISVIGLSVTSVYAFPNGAPVDVCVNDRQNQPKHGNHLPQPISSNPYQIVASDSAYSPGKQISVTLRGDTFKGFFIQARDTKTNEWVGSFAKTANTVTHNECSAITHADPKDKQEATLIWNAPDSGTGQVYFTGSIVKDYATFWVELRSS